jgi:hypothetical protein
MAPPSFYYKVAIKLLLFNFATIKCVSVLGVKGGEVQTGTKKSGHTG